MSGSVWIVMVEEEHWSYSEEEGSVANYNDVPVHVFSTEEAARDFQLADKRLYKEIVQVPYD